MPDVLVQDRSQLVSVCKELREEPWLALDTEFVREQTYYAQLCLVQVATAGRAICIDPLALKDLAPVLDLIYSPRALKILHASRQDLEVFYDQRGSPFRPVFDTQIAASLVGYDDQIGYAPLVKSTLGVKLPKHHTRADWTKRPLPQELLRYAADDVRYLPKLFDELSHRLAQLGRCEWLVEECARLTAPDLYDNSPENAYRRVKKGGTLAVNARNALRGLAAWRERTAQQCNRPRNWILRDAVMIEISRTSPDSLAQLKRINGIGQATARKWGEQILDVIREIGKTSVAPAPRKTSRLDPLQSDLYGRLVELVEQRARVHGISATLLATRRDLKALVLGNCNGPVLTGWRRDVVGQDLLAMLNAGTHTLPK
ncbi:MAG: ribonuclease D [Acidiferrobacterales bacterium]